MIFKQNFLIWCNILSNTYLISVFENLLRFPLGLISFQWTSIADASFKYQSAIVGKPFEIQTGLRIISGKKRIVSKCGCLKWRHAKLFNSWPLPFLCLTASQNLHKPSPCDVTIPLISIMGNEVRTIDHIGSTNFDL